jgi:hypothetical protein
MPFAQFFVGKGRPKIGIVASHQGQGRFEKLRIKAIVAGATSSSRDDPRLGVGLLAAEQAAHLTLTEAQLEGDLLLGEPPGLVPA